MILMDNEKLEDIYKIFHNMDQSDEINTIENLKNDTYQKLETKKVFIIKILKDEIGKKMEEIDKNNYQKPKDNEEGVLLKKLLNNQFNDQIAN